jgi:hypothetical protein
LLSAVAHMLTFHHNNLSLPRHISQYQANECQQSDGNTSHTNDKKDYHYNRLSLSNCMILPNLVTMEKSNATMIISAISKLIVLRAITSTTLISPISLSLEQIALSIYLHCELEPSVHNH